MALTTTTTCTPAAASSAARAAATRILSVSIRDVPPNFSTIRKVITSGPSYAPALRNVPKKESRPEKIGAAVRCA
jgi:hypothetical protein